MIPKIIHQTWCNKLLPNILDNIYKHNMSINNNFVFKLWSHAPGHPEIDDFLKEYYPELYNVFIRTSFGVQKGDIGRLAILYHYGGIYIDLDILCLKPFDKCLDIDFSSDKLYMAYEPSEQIMKILNNNDKYLCNAFVATPAKHPLLKLAIDNIVNMYNRNGNQIFKKFDIFGGGFIQNIIITTIDLPIEMIDTELIFPINDPKFIDLPCSRKDWNRLKNGYYGSKAIAVHYWFHGDFEGKMLIDSYQCDKNKTIHDNVLDFFIKLYPNNAKMLL